MTSIESAAIPEKIRLNEARRLMLTEHMDASTAAYEVGYDSPSQFSREYSRQFGASPMRDIKNLIQVAAV
ncbi:MAG: AraC family transcriptional regulator [Candidatus Competibacteraceae bacterium]